MPIPSEARVPALSDGNATRSSSRGVTFDGTDTDAVTDVETVPLSGESSADEVQEFLRSLILGSKRGSMSVRPWRMVTFDHASLAETQKKRGPRKSLTVQRSSVLGSRRGSKCLKRQGVTFDIQIIDDESQSSKNVGPCTARVSFTGQRSDILGSRRGSKCLKRQGVTFDVPSSGDSLHNIERVGSSKARSSITGQRSDILGSRRGSKCLKRHGVKPKVRFIKDGPHSVERVAPSDARVSITTQRSEVLGSRRGSISGGRVCDDSTLEERDLILKVDDSTEERRGCTGVSLGINHAIHLEFQRAPVSGPAVGEGTSKQSPYEAASQKPRAKKPSMGSSSNIPSFDYSVWLSSEGDTTDEAQQGPTGESRAAEKEVEPSCGSMVIGKDRLAQLPHCAEIESGDRAAAPVKDECSAAVGEGVVTGQASVSPEELRELLLSHVQQGARGGAKAATPVGTGSVGTPGKLLSTVLGTFSVPWKKGASRGEAGDLKVGIQSVTLQSGKTQRPSPFLESVGKVSGRGYEGGRWVLVGRRKKCISQ